MTLKEIRDTIDRVNDDHACHADRSRLCISPGRSSAMAFRAAVFAALCAGIWMVSRNGWISPGLAWPVMIVLGIVTLVYLVRFSWRVTYFVEPGRVIIIDNVLGIERDYVICCNQEDVMLNPSENPTELQSEPLIITRGPRRIRLPFSMPQGVGAEEWLGIVRYYVGGAT